MSRAAMKLLVGICGGALAAAATGAPPAYAATSSSGFQVDAQHSGYLYGAGVKLPLQRAWTDNLNNFETSVAIDNGRVFALAGESSGDWGSPMDVDAIDLATGKIEWSQEVDPLNNFAYLTVDDGIVLATVTYNNQQLNQEYARITAFSEATGTPLWSTILTGSVWLPLPPISHDGVLYVDAEGIGGTVFAIDEHTGQTLWSTPLFVGNAPVWANGTLVIAGTCELSYGLNPATGATLWSDYDNCDGGGTLMSSFDGTHVWGDFNNGYDGVLYDPGSGAMVGSFTGFAPAFGYGEAVQESDGNTHEPPTVLRALDPSSGSVLWSFTEPTTTTPEVGSEPLLADGSVFAEGPEGQVWALDPCTGAVAWQSQVDPPPQSGWFEPLNSLAAGDGYLVVPSLDGLTAFQGSGTPATVPNCTGSSLDNPGTGGSFGPASGSGSGSSGTGSSGSGSSGTPVSAPTVAPPLKSTPKRQVVASGKRALKLIRVGCTAVSSPTKQTTCRLLLRVRSKGQLVLRFTDGRRVLASLATRVVRPGSFSLKVRVRAAGRPRSLLLVLKLIGSSGQLGTASRRVRLG